MVCHCADQLKTMLICPEGVRVLKLSSGSMGTQGTSVHSQNLFCIPKGTIYETKSCFMNSLARVNNKDHVVDGNAGLSNTGR